MKHLTLRVLDPQLGLEVEHPVTEFPTTLGRSPSNGLVIEHPSISSKHAVIEEKDGRFVIRDLGSTNGIVLSGSKVQSVRLEKGAVFLLGSIQVTVELREEVDETKTRIPRPRKEESDAGTASEIELQSGSGTKDDKPAHSPKRPPPAPLPKGLKGKIPTLRKKSSEEPPMELLSSDTDSNEISQEPRRKTDDDERPEYPAKIDDVSAPSVTSLTPSRADLPAPRKPKKEKPKRKRKYEVVPPSQMEQEELLDAQRAYDAGRSFANFEEQGTVASFHRMVSPIRSFRSRVLLLMGVSSGLILLRGVIYSPEPLWQSGLAAALSIVGALIWALLLSLLVRVSAKEFRLGALFELNLIIVVLSGAIGLFEYILLFNLFSPAAERALSTALRAAILFVFFLGLGPILSDYISEARNRFIALVLAAFIAGSMHLAAERSGHRGVIAYPLRALPQETGWTQNLLNDTGRLASKVDVLGIEAKAKLDKEKAKGN